MAGATIIAIDGPAGAGKSTVARLVAERLGLRMLDTGAMYRAVTLRVLERGLAPADAAACAGAARALRLEFGADGKLWVDGQPGEPGIRAERVTRAVSAVSAHPEVRVAIVARQRELAEQWGGLVAEGRDTTSQVFPSAAHKFFLTASAAERARRRASELGSPERAAEIRRDIEERDRLDSTRAHSPLVHVSGAVLIDTDGLTAEQVAEAIVRQVGERTRRA